MYEPQLALSSVDGHPAMRHWSMLASAEPWQGPDRRSSQNRNTHSSTHSNTDWQYQLLDVIDYGIFVLSAQRKLLYANHAAQAHLRAASVLRIEHGELVTDGARDSVVLGGAIRAAAAQGLRRMVLLGNAPSRLPLAVVPGPQIAGPEGNRVLVMLPRGQLCQPLSTYGFARDHGLSGAESQVLYLLCDGLQPVEIAALHGVAITTVRSQIASIRVKTDAGTVAELIQRIARLPPICSALQANRHANGRAEGQARLSPDFCRLERRPHVHPLHTVSATRQA